MSEESRGKHEEAWEDFMEAERKELQKPGKGHLGKALGAALPRESSENLERIAREDQLRAEQGLVELRSGEKVWWYKHIDEVTPEDRQARLEAHRKVVAWLEKRLG